LPLTFGLTTKVTYVSEIGTDDLCVPSAFTGSLAEYGESPESKNPGKIENLRQRGSQRSLTVASMPQQCPKRRKTVGHFRATLFSPNAAKLCGA
jgi:hypothetical protein